MSSVRYGTAFAAATSFLVSFSSFASDAATGVGAETLVVTATRVEQPLSEVIGSVSVITRADIERRGVRSTQDLLRGETGVNVTNTGGLGKLSNIFLRGTDSEHLLVLVDGVRVGSATSGTTAFEYVPVDQIERIEIIRGPRSSLYGSDAIGGVIQIFTRRDPAPSISVGFGSNETSDVSASFGAASERAWVSVAANQVRTEGYNSCVGATNGGCFTNEPDRDGYSNTSGTLRAGYQWDAAEIEASALYATGTSEYDGSFANETDFVQRVTTLRGALDLSPRWTVSLLVGSSRDEQDNFFDDPTLDDGETLMSRFNTERQHASLQSDWGISDAQALTLGVDYLDDRIDSTTAYDAVSRNNVGAFAQYQTQLGAHRLLASARYDDNEQYGGYASGNLGWKWAITERLWTSAGWGRAFGAPTFNDLYYPGFSNPNLDPEESDTYELAVGWSEATWTASLTAFDTRVDELIVYDPVTFIPANLNESRIRGIELDAQAAIGAWSIGVGYAALDPRNRTPGDSYDNYLPRRARHSGHIEVGRSFGPIDGRVRVTSEGSRYDDIGNQYRVDGYAVVDLVLDYEVTPSWSVQAKVGNALDRDYRTVRLYNQEGRTFFVDVRYQPR